MAWARSCPKLWFCLVFWRVFCWQCIFMTVVLFCFWFVDFWPKTVTLFSILCCGLYCNCVYVCFNYTVLLKCKAVDMAYTSWLISCLKALPKCWTNITDQSDFHINMCCIDNKRDIMMILSLDNSYSLSDCVQRINTSYVPIYILV